MPQDRPRAAIIGAGMSGLVSAVLLAMHGYDVEVFEQHTKPGGLLHRFSRKGVAYETGFHYCGSIHRDDILGRCLAHLGVLDRIEWTRLDPEGFDIVRLPGREFAIPVGIERLEQRLVETFPHEEVGIRAFLAAMLEAIEHYGLYRFKAEIDVPSFLHWEGLALGEMLDRHFDDPELKAILSAQGSLYGVAPHEAPFGLHAVIVHHFLSGAYRAKGGGDALAGALVQRLEELGGRVHLGAEVTRLLLDAKRRVQGVELASGARHHAGLVISSLHPRLLFDLIPEEGVVRKAYRTRIMDQKVGLSHFGVYAELAEPIPALQGRNLYRLTANHAGCLLTDVAPGQVPFYFAACPPSARDRKGKLRHTLLLTAALGWDKIAQWQDSRPGRRPGAYRDYKQQLQDSMIEAFLQDFPSARPHLLRAESSTALSTWHYARSPQGAMYGHYHSVPQMGRYRLPQIIRIHNFVQVGQGVFTPGILGATLSAYYGCGYHLGLGRLVQELEAT